VLGRLHGTRTPLRVSNLLISFTASRSSNSSLSANLYLALPGDGGTSRPENQPRVSLKIQPILRRARPQPAQLPCVVDLPAAHHGQPNLDARTDAPCSSTKPPITSAQERADDLLARPNYSGAKMALRHAYVGHRTDKMLDRRRVAPTSSI
jgi:hypothetical protein